MSDDDIRLVEWEETERSNTGSIKCVLSGATVLHSLTLPGTMGYRAILSLVTTTEICNKEIQDFSPIFSCIYCTN